MSQSIDNYKSFRNPTGAKKTRVNENSYGQGYRQIIVDGLNADEENWDIQFVPVDTTTAASLETILLDSVKESSNFILWEPPGDTTSKYFTAQDIMKKSVSPTLWVISCTLRREYILG